MDVVPGMKIGKLTVLRKIERGHWLCKCDCGNFSTPTHTNLAKELSHSCGSCGKNYYRDCEDGKSVEVTATNGMKFYIDKTDETIARKHKWHICTNSSGYYTVLSSKRILLYQLLLGFPKDCEIDHIDLNPLNNRRSNLRICTHQQNQMNQPLQSNNTSGVTGVRYYKARSKFVARLKICQKDIHLGYYDTFQEAVQARNVGMECMFGEYGRYNDVPDAPTWIRNKVIEKCKRFAALSVCRAFLLSQSEVSDDQA